MTIFVTDKLIDALQGRGQAIKEVVKIPLFSLVKSIFVEITVQRKMNALLIGSIDPLIKSERFRDAVTWQVAACPLHITTMTVHENGHMKKSWK